MRKITVPEVRPGDIIRAVNFGGVTVEGPIHHKSEGQFFYGYNTGSVFTTDHPGWTYYLIERS